MTVMERLLILTDGSEDLRIAALNCPKPVLRELLSLQHIANRQLFAKTASQHTSTDL